MLNNCNKALELKPNDVTALNAKALSFGVMEQYEEALECCDKAIEIDRNDVGAWARSRNTDTYYVATHISYMDLVSLTVSILYQMYSALKIYKGYLFTCNLYTNR